MEAMMSSATARDLAEFPFMAELPKREKGKVAKLFDVLEEIGRVQSEKGGIVPQALVAEVLNVSRARVAELVDDGKLDSIRIGQHRFVFLESLWARCKAEKDKGGRPRKVGAWKTGTSIGEGLAEAVGD